MPLIVALRDTNGPDHDFLRQAIIDGGADRLDRVRAVIESTGALQYTLARAQEAADKAIDALVEIPDSDHKQALIALADFSVKRRS